MTKWYDDKVVFEEALEAAGSMTELARITGTPRTTLKDVRDRHMRPEVEDDRQKRIAAVRRLIGA